MDWARAKNIFIVLFFLLNIFLSIILIYTLDSDSISKDTIDDARQALAERGVAITCEIPHFNGSIGTLTYDDTSFNREIIVRNLTGSKQNGESILSTLDIKDESKELIFPDEYSFAFRDSNPEGLSAGLKTAEGVLSFVSNVLRGTGIPVTDYHLDIIEEKEGQKTYIFKQKYKNFWIHENYIVVELGDKGVTYIELRYRKIDSIINGKKVMPVYQVLIRHYDR
ncbi:two-component system regulatory protein YycI [Acetivibrio straminisolvens]|uniref:Regulatory protein YycH-like domain-containing protein n=1 Tax=Acetivibrio straminisolvens JCM 21531 TaxID=1294263 RepID=W4V6C3_9FIRM|nr:two-component system regulatory protein YycI [Acetivibrio straminisolvens]GAE88935.1 hypothetical protein JCM21531_2420 [Acetivibrio straminisolvens JCM 21531]